MESIIDKARKILALAERGIEGEALAAKRALENLLAKHGLTLEDLRNEQRTKRKFSVRGQMEVLIFNHCVLNMFGRKSHVWEGHYMYKRDSRHIYAEMTDIEYLDFSPFFAHHLKHFRKEVKKMLDAATGAYVNKHNLFDPAPSDNDNEGTGDVDMEKLMRVMAVMQSMERSSYHKLIEK